MAVRYCKEWVWRSPVGPKLSSFFSSSSPDVLSDCWPTVAPSPPLHAWLWDYRSNMFPREDSFHKLTHHCTTLATNWTQLLRVSCKLSLVLLGQHFIWTWLLTVSEIYPLPDLHLNSHPHIRKRSNFYTKSLIPKVLVGVCFLYRPCLVRPVTDSSLKP